MSKDLVEHGTRVENMTLFDFCNLCSAKSFDIAIKPAQKGFVTIRCNVEGWSEGVTDCTIEDARAHILKHHIGARVVNWSEDFMIVELNGGRPFKDLHADSLRDWAERGSDLVWQSKKQTPE